MPSKILFRRDTAANWASANPILAEGEMGLVTDARTFKIGDGSTAWNSLEAKYDGVTWLGAWNSGTSYALDDAVSKDGSSYVCILAHSNHSPPNGTYWEVLAAKGDTGATGATGPQANDYATLLFVGT